MIECRHRIPGLDIDIVGGDVGLYIEMPTMGGWADVLDRTELISRMHIREYEPDQVEDLWETREEVQRCLRSIRRKRKEIKRK